MWGPKEAPARDRRAPSCGSDGGFVIAKRGRVGGQAPGQSSQAARQEGLCLLWGARGSGVPGGPSGLVSPCTLLPSPCGDSSPQLLGCWGGDHRGDVVKKLEVISLRAQACVPDSSQLILHPRLPQGGSRCSCPWSHHCAPAPAPAECGTRVHASRPQGGPWEVRRSALPPMLCALVPLPPRGHAICTPLGGSQSLGPHLGKPAQCPAPRLRP